MQVNQPPISNKLIYLAWFSTTVFFMYQYVLRVIPGILIDEIRHEYSMTAEQFSLLGALYLYSYALLQIPVGIIIDKIGIRRTVIISLLLCIAGGYLFVVSNHIIIAYLSRILLGAGSASAFMAALKVAADYLPEGKRGIFVGATLTFGTIGAVSAGKPLNWLIEATTWQDSVVIVSIFGFVILLFCALCIPSQKITKIKHFEKPKPLFSSLGEILTNKRIILYSIAAIGLYTPLAVIADLWGTGYLIAKFGLSRVEAANSSLMVYVGMAIGSLVLPYICEKRRVINTSIKICSVMILLTFIFLLYGPDFTIEGLTVTLIFLGFLCGSEMVCFTAAISFTTKENSGLTIGVVNTLNMLGGAILQQLIGVVLDFNWHGRLDEFDIRIYGADEYVFALSSIIVAILFTTLLSIFGLKGEIGRKKV